MSSRAVWNPYGGLSDEEEECAPKQSSTASAFSTAFAATTAAAAAVPVVTHKTGGLDIAGSVRMIHYLDTTLRTSIMMLPTTAGLTPHKTAAISVLDEWNRLEKVHEQSDDRRDVLKGAYIGIVMIQTLVMIFDAMMKQNGGKEINGFVRMSMEQLAGKMQTRLPPIPSAAEFVSTAAPYRLYTRHCRAFSFVPLSRSCIQYTPRNRSKMSAASSGALSAGRIGRGGPRRPPSEDHVEEARRERVRKSKLESMRRWAAANKEKARQRQRDWVRSHPESTKQHKKQDYIRHREKYKETALAATRRHHLRLHTLKKTLNDGKCSQSGCDIPWQYCDIDHVDPSRKKHELSCCKSIGVWKEEIARNTDESGTLLLQLLCPIHHRLKDHHSLAHDDNELRVAKRVLLATWKTERGSCGLCDVGVESFPLYCFDADHVDAVNKIERLAEIVGNKSYGVDDVQAELGKCRLLCANCHRKVTADQQQWTVVAAESSASD